MVNKKRKMKLVAYRVAFTDHTEITFEQILEQLQERLPLHSDRIFEAPSSTDASVAISKFLKHPSNTGTGAVFSSFHKDAEISTISFDSSHEELGFGTQSASDGEEYLDSNTVLFAVGDMVISCGIGKRKNYLCGVIYDLAVNAGVIPHTTSFNFADIPRGNVLESINKVGVKQVDLDATVLIGSLPKTVQSNVLSKMFGSADRGNAIKRRRENVASISVKNSRFFNKGGVGVVEQDKNEWLDSVAVEVVNDEDVNAYTIILNDNTPIRSGSLLRMREVDVEVEGSTFDVKDAHAKMVKYYHDVQRELLNEKQQ
ncbi:hypothetical protein [Parasulfitobacter algicola]|uniref:Uncharacterized protein n=1 Tax=Parasulfitobacter algicola TaxID=2614809 RepID=A0ABX2IUH8_9RHOB|nr:hypothetical protein [Sulfitobacter algicola]NSX56552.1 hypothetical protein [Sulfitobacter algicola]